MWNVQMIHMAQPGRKGPERPPVIKCNIYKSRLSTEAVRDLFCAWNIKITKGSSMINTKHVLIMCSSYPLMTPSSFQALVVSCLMGNAEKHCGVSRRLWWKSHKWKWGCNRSPLTRTFTSNLLWPKGFWANVGIKYVLVLKRLRKGVNEFTAFDRTRHVASLSGQTPGQKGNPKSHINREGPRGMK